MIEALLVLVLFAAPAVDPARAHFEAGQQLFAQERWREALDEFAAANEAAPRELPELSFNIAQCQRNLGRPRLAVAALERYLALKPDAADRKQVRTLIARLRTAPRSIEPAHSTEPPAPSLEPDPPAAQAAEPPPIAQPAQPAPDPLPPPPSAATSAQLVAQPAAPAHPSRSRPRWWTIVGVAAGVAAGAIAIGVGVGVGLTPTTPHALPPASTPMLGSGGTFDTRTH